MELAGPDTHWTSNIHFLDVNFFEYADTGTKEAQLQLKPTWLPYLLLNMGSEKLTSSLGLSVKFYSFIGT